MPLRFVALGLLAAACSPGRSPPDGGLADGGTDAGTDAGPVDAGPGDAGSCSLSFMPSPDQFGAPCGGFGYNAGLLAAALGPGRDPDLVFWTVDEDGIDPAVNVLHNHDDGGWFSGLSSSAPFGADRDGGSIEAVVVGDFNGDGLVDLAVSGELGTCNTCPPIGAIAVLYGDGQGNLGVPALLPWGNQDFSVAFMGPQSMVAADFDGDGRPDLASAMLDNTVGEQHEDLVLFLTGGGPLQADGGVHHPLTQDTWSLTSLVAADFNGDGLLDLAVAAGEVSVFANTGAGEFGAPAIFAAGYGANWIAVADFDGDGSPDLVIENDIAGPDGGVALQILLNDGHGSFTAQPALVLPLANDTGTSYGGQIAAADFTGDGVPDVATFNSVGDAPVLLVAPGRGDGTLGDPLTFATALDQVEGAGAAVVAARLSGHALPDLAVGVPRSGDLCTKLTTLQDGCN